MIMPESSIGKLRIWGLLEGVSLIALFFVCMPLKYYWDNPEPTQYVGAVHGGLFIFYCVWLLVVTLELKWGMRNSVLAFVAALVPFGTFVADRKIFKPHLPKEKAWRPPNDSEEENESENE